MTKGERIAYYTMVIVMVWIFVFGILVIVDMMVDHYCYTLPLNEIKDKKICERYWK